MAQQISFETYRGNAAENYERYFVPTIGAPLAAELIDVAAVPVRAHLNVFRYPGPDGTRPSKLAARLRMTKQAVNYLLGELERLGYLERRPDRDDARSKRIALTRRGRATVPVIRDAPPCVASTRDVPATYPRVA
jgi:hypothetical protein